MKEMRIIGKSSAIGMTEVHARALLVPALPMVRDAVAAQIIKEEMEWRENNLSVIDDPYDRPRILPEVGINEKIGTRKVNQNKLKKRRKKNKLAANSRQANRNK